MDSRDFFAALEDTGVPSVISCTVNVDMRGVTPKVVLNFPDGVNPQIPLVALTSGVVVALVHAAKYREMAPETLLKEVVKNLEQMLKTHGTIEGKGE